MVIRYYVRYMMYRHRYRLTRIYRAAALYGVIVFLFFLLYQIPLAGILSRTFEGRGFPLFDIALSWSERDPRGLMRSGVPVMAWVGNQEDYPEEISPRSIVTALLAPFRVNLSSPHELLAVEMPALAEFRKGQGVPVSGQAPSPGGGPGAPAAAVSPDALLGIYYTHTGETYAVTDGVERLTGQKGGVVETGRVIKEKLESGYGIQVAHYDRVNDQNYGLSYVESEKTARLLLEENKNIQILLDIHRDAGKSRSESLVRVNGEDLAPILFVVGSDARSPFPTWRNNHDFAVRLAERINKKYPGLCIGVRIKEGRYNQFLHPRAVLVEIGSVNNSTAEAVKTAGMFAGVLAEEIMEIAPDYLRKSNEDSRTPAVRTRAGVYGEEL
ncbi:MAG: stage II sporulation protein P [Bacillota bacterium]